MSQGRKYPPGLRQAELCRATASPIPFRARLGQCLGTWENSSALFYWLQQALRGAAVKRTLNIWALCCPWLTSAAQGNSSSSSWTLSLGTEQILELSRAQPGFRWCWGCLFLSSPLQQEGQIVLVKRKRGSPKLCTQTFISDCTPTCYLEGNAARPLLGRLGRDWEQTFYFND